MNTSWGYKVFVSEGTYSSQDDENERKRREEVGNLKGEEAAKIYQEVLETPSSSKPEAPKEIPKPPTRVKRSKKSFTTNDLFKAAAVNDSETIENVLEARPDLLNAVDLYKWSALMIAAAEGAEDAFATLLGLGANLSYSEPRGQSALSLARRKNRQGIINQIVKNRLKFEPPDEDTPFEPYFCEICCETLQETDRKSHEASTVHQFHLKSDRQYPTTYGIPSTNRGFQLMLKQGWDRERGLGPDQKGHKFPVKTVLWERRSGIGLRQPESRVTHFGPNDPDAVRWRPNESRPLTRRELRRVRERDRQKDRKWRSELA